MIIVPDRELEILRFRLAERDVTIEEVWAYLTQAHPPLNGMQQQLLSSFVSSTDLASFWQLVDWWAPVQDKPTSLQTPSILGLCWYVNYTPGTEPITFSKAMFQFYNRAVAHCQSIGLDPQHLAETPEDRRKRRNRERMAAVRGHRKVPEAKLKHDPALSTQVRELETQIEMLKQQAKEEDYRLKEDVVGYQKRMLDASEERKNVAADFKARIDTLQLEIRSLI